MRRCCVLDTPLFTLDTPLFFLDIPLFFLDIPLSILDTPLSCLKFLKVLYLRYHGHSTDRSPYVSYLVTPYGSPMSVTWFGHGRLHDKLWWRSRRHHYSSINRTMATVEIPATMEFSKTLQNKITAFGRRSQELRELAKVIKQLLIKERFFYKDTPHGDVKANELLNDTISCYLALALSDDPATSKASVHFTDLSLFLNGKNDTALHKMISDAKLSIDSNEFMALSKAAKKLTRFIYSTKVNLIDFMELDESPVAGGRKKAAATKTKDDVTQQLERNSAILKAQSSKRKIGNEEADFIDDDEGHGDEEDGDEDYEDHRSALTELSSMGGENKKVKKGIRQLTTMLTTFFPTVTINGIYLYVDSDTHVLHYTDTITVPIEQLTEYE